MLRSRSSRAACSSGSFAISAGSLETALPCGCWGFPAWARRMSAYVRIQKLPSSATPERQRRTLTLAMIEPSAGLSPSGFQRRARAEVIFEHGDLGITNPLGRRHGAPALPARHLEQTLRHAAPP